MRILSGTCMEPTRAFGKLIGLALGASLLLPVSGQAASLRWAASAGGNDHWYDFVNIPNPTWTEAKTAAENSGGYLATLTSADENAFVGAIWAATHFDTVWLGGYQTPPAPEVDPTADWHWVTGEPWSYTAWPGFEPNNLGGFENYLQYGYFGVVWNDCANSCGTYVSGYMIEYDQAPNPVPLPSALFLFGPALAGFFSVRRSRA